jgi:hypothetical protein
MAPRTPFSDPVHEAQADLAASTNIHDRDDALDQLTAALQLSAAQDEAAANA